MAYAALVSLAQTLNHILNHDQYSVFHHENTQFQSLQEHVTFLQAFLEDSPQKASNLEGRITHIANETEDILERLMYKQIHSLMSSGRGPQNYDFSSRQRRRYKARKFKKQYRKLPKVTEGIHTIVEEVITIKNSLRIQDQQLSGSSPPSSSSIQLSESSPPSSPSMLVPTEKDSMVGFDDDLRAIKTRLISDSSKLDVIPIVGMGGIGKTTLARNAYDDPLTMEKFDIRAWVTVSQDYSKQQILSTLVISIKGFNGELNNYEKIQEHVHKSLKGRRYLIVMDDMWSIDAWDSVRRIFPDDDDKGSRIILTTRLLDVAAYADSSSPLHKMSLMGVDQSWNLLQQKVLKQECCPPELENIGRKIARRCGGLPLAIVVIAGLLSTVSQTKASWENIAEKLNFPIVANDDQFDEILTLSYTHLPHHLRPCFLYMGGFPEDFEIRVSKLIKLWVAESFLKPNESKSFEEAAEQYLEDLVKRSLVLVNERKSNGKIKSCSLHDLMRGLCITKAREEKFLVHVIDRYVHKRLPKSMKNQRRLSLSHSNMNLLTDVYGPTTRTALDFQHNRRLLSFFKSFRLLRVLDFMELKFLEFPDEVLVLFHLRYLAFTMGNRNEFDIPAAILKLQNLQTIILRDWEKWWMIGGVIVHFPPEIWRMAQLRHLVVSVLDPLSDPCATSSALQNLQTLSLVMNFKCTERILQMIPNLKKLRITYMGEQIEWTVYQLHNLVHLHQLEKLFIHLETFVDCKSCLLWERLAFPMTLKKLTLDGFLLRRQDLGMIGSLPNLEVLKLKDCRYEDGKWETTEGEFPQLKFLAIIKSNLKHWITTESSHFPRLERLCLSYCGLREIPEVIGEIPTLELIEMSIYDRSLVESAKRIKEEQSNYGNDSLQIRFTSTWD